MGIEINITQLRNLKTWRREKKSFEKLFMERKLSKFGNWKLKKRKRKIRKGKGKGWV